MKLLQRITLKLASVLFLLFVGWGTLFYYIIVDEINDEVDDTLEEYSEHIIKRALQGEPLPDDDNGTNNSYHLINVSPEYAAQRPSTVFQDEMIYLKSKKETEPARTLTTIFKDRNAEYYQLTVMIPTIEKADLKLTILYWVITLYCILLLTILIVNTLVQRYTLKPLYSMLKWIDNLSLKKGLPPLKRDYNIYEFRRLAEALWQSSLRNAEVYEQQSLFIGHASHELQTPIAVALNRLELLMNDPSLGEEQLKQLIETKHSLESLTKLNRTLLLLTKIENAQFTDRKEISVRELIESLSTSYEEAYAHLGISCERVYHNDLVLNINESLATVLISNLIKNAYLHNRPGGTIAIEVTRRRIKISNTANGEALDTERIFRRFYKESQYTTSTGLGLSLVESICKSYDIKVGYEFSEGMHHFILEP